MEERKVRRTARVRAKISGTGLRPRLAVYRSLAHVYAQLIDDQKGVTLAAASDFEVKNDKLKAVEKAMEVGKLIAQKAKDNKIKEAVFDRRSYQYHGVVKAVAEGAREGGLKI